MVIIDPYLLITDGQRRIQPYVSATRFRYEWESYLAQVHQPECPQKSRDTPIGLNWWLIRNVRLEEASNLKIFPY